MLKTRMLPKVFGAFVGAELPVLKMMGVGLCVSALIDATVIRANPSGPGHAKYSDRLPGHGLSATRQHTAKVAQRRKYFIVQVRALSVVGTLFEFNDLLVL